MTASDRAVRETFVELADTLVTGFDLIDFLNSLAARTAELLGVASCGLLLADHRGNLGVVAASTEQARLLALLQLQCAEGPTLDSYRSGEHVHCADLAEADERWPDFAPAARTAGFATVHGVPMRLRETIIGAMNLLHTDPGGLDDEIVALSRALADMATIGIVHERTIRKQEALADQLQVALNSRVLVEQAKGVIAERRGVSVDEAFDVLASHARSAGVHLLAAAHTVVHGGGMIFPGDEVPTAG